MIVINERKELPDEKYQVVLGKFDGFHKGHQTLMEALQPRELAGKKLVLTFDFSVSDLPALAQSPMLFSEPEREYLAAHLGMDVLVRLPFDETLRTMGPEQFFEEILVRQCHAKTICVGTDYHFGFHRAGDTSLMQSLCDKHGITCKILPEYSYEDHKLGSTDVRELLLQARFTDMESCLGYPYFARGIVLKGRQLGRTIGYPTLNLKPDKRKLLPPRGVYATYCFVDGICYPGITNIGTNPTVTEEGILSIETHLIDTDLEAYGHMADVYFLRKMREETRFDGLLQLKAQLSHDAAERRDLEASNCFAKARSGIAALMAENEAK